jgi:hypothetical protein
MISPPKHWQHSLQFCKRLFGLFVQNVGRALQRYGLIDGEQCAASFAYYAFFSLFPLILLCVALATIFLQNREVTAASILIQVDQYLPLQESDRVLLLHTIDGVIKHGLGAGLLGFLVLTWSSLRFSQALVIGVNRAWGLKDYNWWKLPLKNLLMIGIAISAIALGLVTPLAFDRLAELFGWGNVVTHRPGSTTKCSAGRRLACRPARNHCSRIGTMPVRDLFDANRQFQRRVRRIRIHNSAFVLDLRFRRHRDLFRVFRRHNRARQKLARK